MTMTALEPGFALVFAIAVLQGRPVDVPEHFPVLSATRSLLLADLTAVPEPKQADQKTPPDPPPQPPPVQKPPDARPHEPPPPKRVETKCYDDLLDFSLGDSDKQTNERLKSQDCK